jgi:hypothetical protein
MLNYNIVYPRTYDKSYSFGYFHVLRTDCSTRFCCSEMEGR